MLIQYHRLYYCSVFIFVTFFHAFAEEPLPPACSTFYGRRCDATLQTCVFANSSNTEAQCECYETHVACLRAIDPKNCLRGAHCKLFYNSCTKFYCPTNPIRCATCTSESEIDRPPPTKNFFFRMISTPSGATVFIILVLLVAYHCFGFASNVIFHGASCNKRACPQYKRWRKLRKQLKKGVRRARKSLKNRLKHYQIVNGDADSSSLGEEDDVILTENEYDDEEEMFKEDDSVGNAELSEEDDSGLVGRRERKHQSMEFAVDKNNYV